MATKLELNIKPFITWPLLLALCLPLAGCGTGAPEEPAGLAAPLNKKVLSEAGPQELRLSSAWARMGFKFLMDGDLPRALGALHKAEDTFPDPVPSLEGHPKFKYDSLAQVYNLKTRVYLLMRRPELAAHFLALAEETVVHPADKEMLKRNLAVQAYINRDYEGAKTILAGSKPLLDKALRHACEHELGDKSAQEKTREIYRQLHAKKALWGFNLLPTSVKILATPGETKKS